MTVPPIPQMVTELKIPQNDLADAKFCALSWFKAKWQGILSEFIATMMLLLFGCMSCIPAEGIDSSIYVPFAFGFVVMFNIQIFGHISGAFMNPAVTLASVIWGSTSIGLGIVYVIVECAGAILGYGILVTLAPVDIATKGIGLTKPYEGLSNIQAMGIEAALTIALTLINCGVWDPVNANKQDSAPIKFGLTIIGLSLVGGPLSGASMNPARSLGPAVWTGFWAHQWIYWVGPFVGSAVAALFYKYVLKQREIEQAF